MSIQSKASAIIVGCGRPLRSMGWYHAFQLLDNRCPSAVLNHVVEPWFMSKAGAAGDGGAEFQSWRKDLEATRGVNFYESVTEIPAPLTEEGPRLGIISARTADNPVLFNQCLDIGCKSIYLEKPGAPTVAELESMRDMAKDAGVNVLMGFNKNVSNYSTKTMDFASSLDDGHVTFVHNNAYENTEQELGECFERNSEGMLKNMAIHELALLVTFYGVSVDNISKVVADKDYSSCQTLKGPSGKEFTDFDKLKFTITTKEGVEVSVAADRCGGDDSVGIVTDKLGEEVFRYSMPDEDAIANIPNLEKKVSGAMPYFYVQDPDYCTLKERIAKNCVDGSTAEGVASIDVAVETLKVAEYLTPLLQAQLLD